MNSWGSKVKIAESTPLAVASVATALRLLESATSVPGCPFFISSICSVALQVIQMAQTAQHNRKTCNVLADRISQILVAVLMPYVEQKALDTPTSMPENIERLMKDLVDISIKLREVLGKKTIKMWVLSSHYKQEIADYCTKLDWAMNMFKVDVLTRIEIKLDELQSNPATLPTTRPSDPPVSLPPRPEIFFGRDDMVEDLVRRLVSTPNGRFSVGGPGGLGKTSVALMAAHDPRVVATFEDRRYWVPCDQVTTPSSLIHLLVRSLEMSTTPNDLLKQLVAQLRRDNTPKLVLLDNFETPWDVVEERPDIGNILNHLVSVSCVTLLLTVRSERPPCTAIKWTSPILEPLDTLTLDAARQLYIQWHPDAAGDHALEPLLHELSCMPLAVTLMASRGAFGESPTELLTRWRAAGTAMLGRSGTRVDSVQASIRLSTESRTMKAHPDASELLSLLTLLPAGAPKDLLPRMAPDIDTAEAVLVLRKVSLASIIKRTNYVCLLSPIQQLIAEVHPPSEQRLDTVFRAYRQLLLDESRKINSERSWIPVNEALVAHFANLEAILLKRLKAGSPEDAIDLTIQICGWRDSPANLQIIQAASTAADRITDALLNARCKYACARSMFWTDTSKAMDLTKVGLAAFQELNEQSYTLRCLRLIAKWLYVDDMYEDAILYAEQAVELARTLNDEDQYARSLTSLAQIYLAQGTLDDALATMKQVHQIRERTVPMEGSHSVIDGLLIYASILRQYKQFEGATAKITGASAKIQQLVDQTYYEGWRQSELGHLYRDQAQIDEALVAYATSAAIRRKGGFIGDALRQQANIGEMLILKGQYGDAEAIFQCTLEEASESGLQKVAGCCSEQLRCIEIRRQPQVLAGEETYPGIYRTQKSGTD